jgi:hypothetical protein
MAICTSLNGVVEARQRETLYAPQSPSYTTPPGLLVEALSADCLRAARRLLLASVV